MRSSNRGGCGSPIINFITFSFMGLSAVFFLWVVMLALNPNAMLGGMSLNPFPPNNSGNVVVVPTYTAVAAAVMPTFPPTDTPQPTTIIALPPTETSAPVDANETAAPTETLALLPTQTEHVFGATSTATEALGALWFTTMSGMPLYQDYETCDSMWLGGAVFDAGGAPYTNIVISLTGMFGEETAFAGGAQHRGESGYEFQLTNDGPKSGSVFLQLLDGDTFDEISDLTIIETKSSCDENYIQVDWTQSEKE